MPEEQEQQCIFCKIAKGEVPSLSIYSDNQALAILDINPATKGHVLIIPKEHHQLMPMVPEELAAHLGQVAKHIADKALTIFKAKKVDIFAATGAAAGQNAPHVILHVIPRYDEDGVDIKLHENQITEEELKKIQDALIPKVEAEFGMKLSFEETKSEEKPETEKEETQEEKTEDNTEDKENTSEQDQPSEEPKNNQPESTEEEEKLKQQQIAPQEPDNSTLDSITDFMTK